MKSHSSLLASRMLRAGLRVHASSHPYRQRYSIVCAGVDYRGRIISVATNLPRLPSRGWHAEERVLFRCPPSIVKLIIARYNKRGEILPIDPCENCERLANKRGVKIERLSV